LPLKQTNKQTKYHTTSEVRMESHGLSLVQKLEAQDQGTSTIMQGNNVSQQEMQT
jgi:hypothetical protein